MTNTQKLTESGLARELNVSRQAIHDLVKRKILDKDQDGKIDLETAKTALMNSVRPSSKTSIALQASEPPIPLNQPQTQPASAPTPAEGIEATSYHVAKTLREAAEAQMARIRLEEMRGTYLVKADFERYLFNAGRMMRDSLANCARRIGAEVAGLTTADECEAVIDREHRAMLASFAQMLRHTIKIEIEQNPLNAPIASGTP